MKIIEKIKQVFISLVSIINKNQSSSLLIFAIIVVLFLGWQIHVSINRMLERQVREVEPPPIIEREVPQIEVFPPNGQGWDLAADELMQKIKGEGVFKYAGEAFGLWNTITTDLAPYIEANEKLRARAQEIDRTYGMRFRQLHQKIADQGIVNPEIVVEMHIQFYRELIKTLEDFIELVEETK
jgi:hypothetical protein